MSISVVFTLKDILGRSIFVSVGSKERRNCALNVGGFSIFSSFANIKSYQSALRRVFTIFPIWYVVGVFVVIIISLLFISWMCIIWLKIDIFPWRFVLTICLSLWDVMIWILSYFTVSYLLDIASMTCCMVVGYFFPILSTHTLVIFISG